MNQQNAPLTARLFYIQLGSSAPERLAHFYAQIFGMQAQASDGGDWICRGPNRCLVFCDGPPNSLLSVGYAVADAALLPGLDERASASLVAQSDIDCELFEPGAVALCDPDGNRVVYGRPTAVTPEKEPDALPARLQHVVVASTNAARMVAFYTTIVGLRKSDEVLDEKGDLRACFLRSDDEHHSFAVFKGRVNRLDHHCYELPDWSGIRDWGDRLAARYIPVKWGPGRHGPGNNLFLFFHDPDGNWVELSTELEVVSAGRPAGIWRHEERTLNSWGSAFLRS